jgi:hypothetical protein
VCTTRRLTPVLINTMWLLSNRVDETAPVIAASGSDMEVNDGRDILLRKQTGGVATNQQFAPCIRVFSLCAPFPSWHARPSWDTSLSVRLRPTVSICNTDNLNKRMSQVQFRSFRLHMRDSDFPSIHSGSKALPAIYVRYVTSYVGVRGSKVFKNRFR